MPRAEFAVILGVTLASLIGASASGQTVVCNTTATPVPDGAGSVDIVVDGPADGSFATDVRVSLDVTHPWLGDLTVTVSHAGQSAVLIDRVASGVWSFGCGGADIDAEFADDAAQTAGALCVPGGPTPMLAGDILPDDALSVFNGLAAGGPWTVTIADGAAFDAGVVNGVCISFVPVQPCDGDVDGDGDTDLADFSDLGANFGASGLPFGAGESRDLGDLDDDGDVDLADFSVLGADFGCTP